MSHGSRNVRCWWACALLLLAGCGRGSSPANQAVPAAANPPVAGLPFPGEREAAGLTEDTIPGKAAELRSPGATDWGTALLLDGASGRQFALYRINTGPSQPDSLSVIMEAALTDDAYLMLANYATGRWETLGPYQASKTLLIDDPAYRSPGGNLWLAVLVMPGKRAVVNAISVRSTGGNTPPTASILADPPAGPGPLNVTFTAQAADSDGAILQYEWDWESDGTYDEIATTAAAGHVFTAPGPHTVTLRVMDNGGALASAQVQVLVRGWGIVDPPLAPAVAMLANCSLAWIDGRPAVAYFAVPAAGGNGATITFRRATDAMATNWEAPVEVTPASTGYGLDMALVAGNPAIVFSHSNEAFYVRAADSAGQSWGTPQSLPGGTSPGGWCRLSLVNGRPAVVLMNSTGTQESYHLYFSRALDTTGAAWPAQPADPDPSTSGNCPSLAVVDGKPALAYFDQLGRDMKYVASLDMDGAAWGTPQTLVSGSADLFAAWPTLMVIGGQPAICYQETAGSLAAATTSTRYIRALNAAGSAWGAPQTLGECDSAGYGTAMALIAGKPAVVATTYDSPAQLILASDETGASWQPVQTLGAVGCLPTMLGDPAAGALLAYVGAPDWTAPSVLNWAREF